MEIIVPKIKPLIVRKKIPEITSKIDKTGLRLYLDFAELSGNLALDQSGYGNHGIIYGASRVKRLGYDASYFDGVDDYVKIPTSESLDITDAITIEVWINALGNVGSGGFVGKGSAYLLAFNESNCIYFNYYNGSDWVGTTYSNRSIKDSNWHYVEATYSVERGTVQIVIDGILDKDNPVTVNSINVSLNDLAVGYISGWSSIWYYEGLIAMPRVYSYTLSLREIREHFENERILFGV